MLAILNALDPETPLKDILHPFDRLYGLQDALEKAFGRDVPSKVVEAMETCGDVQEWCGEMVG